MLRAHSVIGRIVACCVLWSVAVPCAAKPHSKAKASAQRRHAHVRSHGAKPKSEPDRPETTERDTSLDALDTSPLVPEEVAPVASPPREQTRDDSRASAEEAAPASEAAPAQDGASEDVGSEATEQTSGARAGVGLSVAGGATSRSIELTGFDGLRRLDTGWVPAVALEVHGAVGGERAWIEWAALYESSVHTFGAARSPDPTSQLVSTPIRSQRFEGGIRPSLRLGASDASMSGAVFLGYGVRAFNSVAELQVPRFTEHGPLARLELEVPLIGTTLWLRIAPEFQAFVSISRVVRRIGETNDFGMAFGGEASLRLQAFEWLALAIDYRESHAIVRSAFPDPFRDIERFVLLRIGLRL